MPSIELFFNRQQVNTYPFDKPKLIVGREPGCDIHIDNVGVSRQHCELTAAAGGFMVRDLGSSNGTFVNGRKVAEFYLNDGDEIMLGKYLLKFVNEKQVKSEPQSDEIVPGTTDTYVMEGGKIREQLAKLRSQAGPEPGQPPLALTAEGAPPPKPVAASAPAVGMTVALAISLLLNVVLFAAVAFLAFRLWSK